MRAPYAYTSHTYLVTVTTNSGRVFEWGWMGRSLAASKISTAKDLLSEGMITGYSVQHESFRVEPDHVDMCAGCGDRPALWDMDCDGPYATASCDVCDWHACFDRRYPL